MITLHKAPRRWGLASISPACMKLEAWLRIAGIPYTTAPGVDLAQAPKGKLPFVEYDDRVVGDSTLVIEELKAARGKDPDAHLSAVERAVALAFRRMIKENIYWAIVEVRYRVPENWALYRQVLAHSIMPGVAEAQWGPVVDQIGSQVREQMYGHGMGRHSGDEVARIARDDFTALADFLGDKPYFMGDKPSTVDATAYAYIANLIEPPLASPIVDHVCSLENLPRYVERMTQELFPELAGE